ncbi:MAG: hypothetical protein H0V60_11350 [Actinobacteria bacterium]|nr:hypothetical protein [Actinomycetota bacterium]
MTEEDREREERAEREGRARPKVVDKRISARRAAGEATATPSTPPDPVPVPQAPEPVPAAQVGADEPDEVRIPQAEGGPPQGGVSGPDDALWTPEAEAEAERIATEIVTRPSLEWVVNVAVTLANVAGTKLEAGAAADSRLAIDAFAAIVNGLGAALDDAEQPLRQTLAQLQLAYAQKAGVPGA